MPIIIKNKQENIVTNSVLDEDLNDFLDDPELFRDPLPQPYRRIDRILDEILDESWTIIENNAREKSTEQAKYRPEKCSKITLVKGIDDFNCLSASNDEESEFIFIGSNGSLTCIDSATMSVLDRADLIDERSQTKEGTNIISISSSRFNSQVHLVCSLSDKGLIFMHLFCQTKFYLINFEVDPNERKYMYRRCEMAKNCTYFALFCEQIVKSPQLECLIEVYKCPKDLWAQHVENLCAFRQDADHNEVAVQQLPAIQKPILLCKIKPPANLLKTSMINYQNISHLLKLSEGTHPEVIGIGINNAFTKNHLDLKTQVCEKFLNVHLTDEFAAQITGNFVDDSKLDVEIRFLYSNRLLNVPTSLDQLVEIPNGLAVCWNKSSQTLFYPFIRLTKDLESRAEYSMPFSSQVMQIEMSKCNSLIAFILKNNNLVIFDLIYGIDRCTVNFKGVDSIKRLYFLPPALPQNNKSILNFKQSQLKIPTRLVCLLSNGEIHVVDCTHGSNKKVEKIFEPVLANKDDLCVDFFPCIHLPNLVIVLSITNKLFVFDISRRQMILELSNVDNSLHSINSENFQCAFTNMNQSLFIKGCGPEINGCNVPLLICHSLRLIPQLEDFFAYNSTTQYYPSYLPVRSGLNDRINILMEERIDEQSARKDRLKKMWSEIQTHRNI